MPRVRLAAFGASSIDIEVRGYVATTSVHEFMAVQEELLQMIMRQVEAAGTSMAFPSTTAYLSRDDGIPGPSVLPTSHVSGDAEGVSEGGEPSPAPRPDRERAAGLINDDKSPDGSEDD